MLIGYTPEGYTPELELPCGDRKNFDWLVFVFSFKFLILYLIQVENIHSEDNIKDVEERFSYLLLFSKKKSTDAISAENLLLTMNTSTMNEGTHK